MTKVPRQFSNLYQFIRLVLGNKISDRQIARAWEMDEKNLYEFKIGRYPVPRIERLVSLARVLRINEHLVFEVAKGNPAQRVYNIIKNLRLAGKESLTTRQLRLIHQTVARNKRQYQSLVGHTRREAVLIVDVETRRLIDCNKQAEKFLQRGRDEIIGMHRLQLYPPAKRYFYQNLYKNYVLTGNLKGEMQGFIVLEVVRKDGKIIPVLASAEMAEVDGRKVVQGIFRDISKLKFYDNKILTPYRSKKNIRRMLKAYHESR